ncbi:hypothetical protein CPAST_c01590 [Clostridium pasteurianum DSM 525 = ATCC 6013]|uniref:DUF218 domain-containing protein n=2 Tax=Clostridium pasteurianum TaxID=1501 RepID=A0A0H3IZ04_CLOPA|nr:YdcF family protein [Clostridium pasteurianum]AJA46259.1 hypothetical protein CPAST_c01590 [Clostridium pasteurianum DSM 525 = ATCC 6013]AJA50247.1 hypothetical protein CLPA_c01590 [Clostridium pasteurianum DSM 525 = ATCC 6013]AOZ73712.1 hypothetical protein AQ983_00780 [Clostridium pasteurianum DSM 525 = ATCC 6013]AOZ77509.1 hypothetical protein AQ984_00780 [Clostridium pasteurianum]ELP60843.1 hypothetical protein F502_00240 [Clostridium pasteurianum DSM 525 = ATCC 6013]
MNFKTHLFEKFMIILGLLNILYFIICFFTFRIIVNFSGFFLLLGFILIVIGALGIKFPQKYKILIRIFKGLISFILIVFIILQACIIYNANTGIINNADYIMILGGGIRGKSMLLIQLQRTEKALEFIKKNPDVKIIVSGGQGPGEDISEAEAMKEYLIKHGVNSENIIKEDKSKNTMQNMKYTAEILKAADSGNDLRIGIVTSNFHIFRAKFLARRAGLNAEGISAPSNELLLPNFSVRECFAIIKSFFLDK